MISVNVTYIPLVYKMQLDFHGFALFEKELDFGHLTCHFSLLVPKQSLTPLPKLDEDSHLLLQGLYLHQPF